MKKQKFVSAAIFFALVLSISTGLYAQDPVKVASNVIKKVLLDNDQVRVLYVEYAAGETTPWHSHPNHTIYALTDGKLEITEKDKPVKVMEIKAGEAVYMPAVTHIVKNTGSNTIKLVVTELKAAK